MEQCTIQFYINRIYALPWHIKHVGIKYGVDPNESILSTGMKHDFEGMCDSHEATKDLVPFLNHVVMYILPYKCIYTYYTLFLCL